MALSSHMRLVVRPNGDFLHFGKPGKPGNPGKPGKPVTHVSGSVSGSVSH